MTHYFRKVIHVAAEDSPNVLLALDQLARGREPTGEVVVPGVLTYADYRKRRATWDKVRQCIGLDGRFYEGAEILLFPPEWLNRAEQLWRSLAGKVRQAKAIGIDPAEGGDRTAMAAGDEYGLIELVSRRTPDTTAVTAEAIWFGRKHNVPPDKWVFDRGGGGKEHADRLRLQGYKVQTVAFGEAVTPGPKRGYTPHGTRVDEREEKYAYKNRRAEMYGTLSNLMDPAVIESGGSGFALPPGSYGEQYTELRRQLAPIPKLYDPEGRLELPPKNKRPNSTVKSLVDIIGHSPDEADAVVLMVYAMTHKHIRPKAGAL